MSKFESDKCLNVSKLPESACTHGLLVMVFFSFNYFIQLESLLSFQILFLTCVTFLFYILNGNFFSATLCTSSPDF